MEVLKIKKVQENAVIPKRATEGSAGLDLCACIDAPLTLSSGDTALIPTGLAIELPSSQYGAFVFARSGLSIKHGIGLLNAVGVIDSDYRGEIKVGVINQIKEPYTIEPGERIAQLVIMPVATLPVEEAQTLGESERGAGGQECAGHLHDQRSSFYRRIPARRGATDILYADDGDCARNRIRRRDRPALWIREDHRPG